MYDLYHRASFVNIHLNYTYIYHYILTYLKQLLKFTQFNDLEEVKEDLSEFNENDNNCLIIDDNFDAKEAGRWHRALNKAIQDLEEQQSSQSNYKPYTIKSPIPTYQENGNTPYKPTIGGSSSDDDDLKDVLRESEELNRPCIPRYSKEDCIAIVKALVHINFLEDDDDIDDEKKCNVNDKILKKIMMNQGIVGQLKDTMIDLVQQCSFNVTFMYYLNVLKFRFIIYF